MAPICYIRFSYLEAELIFKLKSFQCYTHAPYTIMSLPRSDSIESLCTVLTCASEEFRKLYDDSTLPTNVLCNEARYVINLSSPKLRTADQRYRLCDLLNAMLQDAPCPSGRRYVAVCLQIAQQKGEDGVVNAAKAWLDYLLLPGASKFVFLSPYIY